ARDVSTDVDEPLPLIAAEIARARSHVHIAGWHFSPDFALVRNGEEIVLRDLLARAADAVDVRVLVWAGAPLPLFRPSRRDMRKLQAELTRGTRIDCRLD